jgi:transglutaminase-like putative cysteine protease
MTGLSDKMRLGEIQRLVMSEEVAFRVKFEGRVPKASLLYWRGPVLWHTDGRNWTPGLAAPTKPPVPDRLGLPTRYTVTLEPHNKRWLFLLDVPTSLPPDSELQGDLQVLARDNLNKRLRYEAASALGYRVAAATPAELKRALQLPRGQHPKAVALGRSWAAGGAKPEDIVKQGLLMFRQQRFYYTLTPDEVEGPDVIDHFLFTSKNGFCEHYAAAFTVLMRAAGLPTRVVTGYQGGEPNDFGGYVIIYQSDAHAWTEVWLGEERGWVRVDPTAAVAPSRVDRGFDVALPRPIAVIPRTVTDNALLRSLWRGMRHGWDAINNGWNQWVLNYGSKRQMELLAKLGMTAADWGDMVLWLVLLSTGTLLVVSAWLFLKPAKTSDPIAAAYLRFCARLARLGFERGDTEGPVAYAQRAAAGRPDLAAPISRITQLYIDLRYGLARHHVRELALAIQAFRPRRRAPRSS